MEKWILIMYPIYGAPVRIVTQEFDSEESCKAAAAVINDQTAKDYIKAHAVKK